jgi:transposase
MQSPTKKSSPSAKKTEFNVYAAELFLALEDRGISQRDFARATKNTSHAMSESTLSRNVTALKKGQSPYKDTDKRGRPAKLTDEQWNVVAGAILCFDKKTDLPWVVNWIDRNFHIDIDNSTASRHLKELKLSIKLANKRPMPKNMTHEEYVKLYYNDILELERTGFWKCQDSRIYTIDATSNSRRLERITTIGICGGPPKKLSRPNVIYTDTYLAAVWKDGVNRTPTLMFSHNPAFDNRNARWNEVKEWCRAWGLETEQIIFVKSDKQYCASSKDQVAHFKRVYRDRIYNTRVMHDAGNEFKFDGESILGDGADREFVFTPATHGEESVLDNHWFAIAKQWWRTERQKYCGDDVDKQSVYLLYCIDYYKSDQIQNLYNRNFLLDGQGKSLRRVEDMLSKNTRLTFKNQNRVRTYVEAYQKWAQDNEETFPGELLDTLNNGLDGQYWN